MQDVEFTVEINFMDVTNRSGKDCKSAVRSQLIWLREINFKKRSSFKTGSKYS